MDTVRLFGHHVQGRALLLGAVEALLALAAVYVAAFTQEFVAPALFDEYTAPQLAQAATFVGVVMLSMMSLGLYQVRLRDGGIRLLVRVAISLFVAALGMAIVAAVFPGLILGADVLVISLAFLLLTVAMTHLLFFRILDKGGMTRRILFYGAGTGAAATLSTLRRKTDRRLFKLMGCVSLPEEAREIRPQTLVELDQALDEYVREQRIDEVVLAMDERRGRFPTRELLACRLAGVDVTNMLDFYERHTGRIKCDLLNPSDIILADGFKRHIGRDVLKRTFDLAVSVILLPPALLLIGLAGLAIKLEEGLRAPIFYRQTRVGAMGRYYQIMKMRSMRVDAEKGGGARWAVRGDDRITRVGAILRKFRIDELPQLFNVIRGHMTLVGPRPERPHFVDELSENLPFYGVRHRVKPGITGWAQLLYPYGSSDDDALHKLEFDLYYVKNASLFLDLVILVGTVEVILFRKGAR